MASELPESSAQWFESCSSVGKDAETTTREHESFKKRVLRALKLKERDAELASSREGIQKQLSEIPTESPISSSLVIHELDSATKAHDAYQQDRAKGHKKVTSAVQHRLNAVAQFIGGFEGIIEKVASAGGPYGEVAYQTLSILLMVVVNKTKNDTRVVEHLEEVKKLLPTLDVWRDIYPNPTMRDLVAEAYQQVLAFSRAATEYLTRFWHRVYLAINPLATVQFEDVATSLHKTLAEINAVAMLGLHEASRTIKQTVLSLKTDLDMAREQAAKYHQELLQQAEQAARERQKLMLQNDELNSQIEQLKWEEERRERQEDLRKLAAFRELLGVDPELKGTHFPSVKSVLMDVFPNHQKFSPNVPYTAYLQLHEAYFKGLSQYQQWLDHSRSSLLFLSGSTHAEGRRFKGFTHCWLSPAAIYIAEGLTRRGCKVAYFSCHPDLESTYVPGDTVLSSIIYQILEWRPEILRNKESQLQQTFASGHHRTKEHMLVDLLGEVLLEFRDLGTVYIVIDRLDRCQSKIDNIGDELARLITVFGSVEFRIKIAMVAETSGGQGNWHWTFLPEHEYATDRLFIKQDWNQRRLTPMESALPRRPSIWSTPSSDQSTQTVS